MIADVATYYLKEFDRLTEDFAASFGAMPKAEFLRPAREGGWSPAQAIEHLLRAEKGTLRLMSGPTERVEGRRADEKCAQISTFVETRGRIQAPPNLVPQGEPTAYVRDELLDRFVDRRADIRVAYEFADDIAAVVTAYEHPVVGHMTLCEWLYFTAVHGERHRRQVA